MILIKILKIAFGSALAIVIADLLGLQFGTAAGIITLLTIQDTAKETIFISIKRLLAFVIATILALGIFNIFGYQALSFGVFLLPFVWSCYTLKLSDAIPMNSVLTTHYLLSGNITSELVLNELFLLVIGAGIGTILNLYIPSNVKKIRQIQSTIEHDLKGIMSRMAIFIVKESKDGYTDRCFSPLDKHIELGFQYAYANMNNTFIQETQYFISYMDMRKQQCNILKNIYEKIVTLETVPNQAKEIADYINHISVTFEETNNAKSLLSLGESLLSKFQDDELPISRDEFEARAILYVIMKDMEYFLKIKASFADSLSTDQIRRYWKNS